MELKAGYKQTTVGPIPQEWSVIPLGLIAPLQRGFDLPNRALTAGSYPVVYSNGIESFHGKPMVKGPGVITGRSGTLGKVHFVESDYWPHNTTLWVTRFGENDPKFIYYVYANLKFERFASGSGVPTLNRNDAHSFQLAVPSDPQEQRAIASALSDVDALIAGLEKLIAKKRDLKQASMQQLLTGQTRLPGFSGEWVEVCLGDLARIQRGASPRPIESPVWFDDTSSVGWVRISDVTNAGMHLTETQQKLSPLGIQHSRPVERGNLIMSICATVGRPVITEIDVCIHDGFVVFDKPKADMHFLYYVLKWIEPNWSKQGQTGSQMNLNTPLINGTKIMLPPDKEQTAIAETLSAIDTELVALESRLTKTRELKQGMMQELLTGRTRLI